MAQEVGSRTRAFEAPSMRFTILVESDREVSRRVCGTRFEVVGAADSPRGFTSEVFVDLLKLRELCLDSRQL